MRGNIVPTWRHGMANNQQQRWQQYRVSASKRASRVRRHEKKNM